MSKITESIPRKNEMKTKLVSMAIIVSALSGCASGSANEPFQVGKDTYQLTAELSGITLNNSNNTASVHDAAMKKANEYCSSDEVGKKYATPVHKDYSGTTARPSIILTFKCES